MRIIKKRQAFYAAIFYTTLSALYIPTQSYGAAVAVAGQARPIPVWCMRNLAAAAEPANSYKYVAPFPANMPAGVAPDGGAVNHYNEHYDIHFSVGQGAINRLVELMTNGNADREALIQWFDNRSGQIKTYLAQWPINLDYYRPEQAEEVIRDDLIDLIVSAIFNDYQWDASSNEIRTDINHYLDNRIFPYYCMLTAAEKQNITAIVEDFGLNVPLQWDGDVPPKITLSPEQSFLFMRQRLAQIFKKMLDEGKDSFKVMMAYMLQLIERQGANAQDLKKIFIAECLVPSTYAYVNEGRLPTISCSKGVLERIILGLNQTMSPHLPDAIKEEILFNVNKIAFLNDGGLGEVAQHFLSHCKDFQPIMDARTPQAKVQALVDQVVSGVCDKLTGGRADRLAELINSPQYPANWGDQKDPHLRRNQIQSPDKETQREGQFSDHRIRGAPYSITFQQVIKNYIAFASSNSQINLQRDVQKLEGLYGQGIRHGKDVPEDQPVNPQDGPPKFIILSDLVNVLREPDSENIIELNGKGYKIFEAEPHLLTLIDAFDVAHQLNDFSFIFEACWNGVHWYRQERMSKEIFLVEENQTVDELNDRIKALRAQKSELERQLAQARRNQNPAQAQNPQANAELERLRAEHAQALQQREAQVQGLQGQLDQRDRDARELRGRYQQDQQAFRQREVQVQELQRQLGVKNRELEDLRGEYRRQIEMLRGERQQALQAVREMRIQIDEKDRELENLRAQHQQDLQDRDEQDLQDRDEQVQMFQRLLAQKYIVDANLRDQHQQDLQARDRQIREQQREIERLSAQQIPTPLNIIDFETENSGPSVLNIAGFGVPEAGYGRWSIQDNASIQVAGHLPNQFVLTFTGQFSAGNEHKDLPIKMGSTIVHIRHTMSWNEFTQRILVNLEGEEVDKIEFEGFSLHPAEYRSIGLMVKRIKIQPIE